MPDFPNDLNDGIFMEKCICKYTAYKNIAKLIQTRLIIENPNNYPQLPHAEIIEEDNKHQIDLIEIYNDNWCSAEVKWDMSKKYLTYNLFIEFQDEYNDGRIKTTGPWLSVKKRNERKLYQMRDRFISHGKDIILYIFTPRKLIDYIEQSNFRQFDLRNQRGNKSWITSGFLVPESGLDNIYDDKIIISKEEYLEFFSRNK